LETRGSSKLKFTRKITVKIISITAFEGAIGIYLIEYEAKPILPIIQPNKLRHAIMRVRNNNKFFLLIS
jgi:hypothetical protein